MSGKITKVSGALVEAKGMGEGSIYEVVRVGDARLMGEIIEMRGDIASIQVYEETSGMRPGEPVERTESQLTVKLGPGLLSSIYDGIQRPLASIAAEAGDFVTRGIDVSALPDRKWDFVPGVAKGDKIKGGDVIGTVRETELVDHRVMVPPSVKDGEVIEISGGSFGPNDVVGKIKTAKGDIDLRLSQDWPIREPRPVKRKIQSFKPLVTGQRVVDTFFPVAKGGSASVPGPFGAGKTVILSQIAKWADADIIIYIGCGERGNEMTDVLHELEKLKDKSGKPLLERTVIVANTSNMPVAAREASIYTGITIAEYFRDMGYSVALMADSTSRWAEALREMSARLEEMPGEEGYPAYLGSRLAAFYERAGYVKCAGSGDREGALTVIGSVSPPGGDLSEPVTQNTLRTTKVFWGLEARLANARHFPSINWLSSYSLYLDDLADFFERELGSDFLELRSLAMKQLAEEARLEEIVRLVGFEALSEKDKLTWETARIIREDFLMQNAFDDVDTYTSLKKQGWMLRKIMGFYKKGLAMIDRGSKMDEILALPEKAELSRIRFVSEEEIGNH